MNEGVAQGQALACQAQDPGFPPAPGDMQDNK